MNYKYENILTGKLNWYIGAGVGVVFVDVDHSWKKNAGFRDVVAPYSDTEFFGQVFAGLVYNVSESFELFSGGRYVYMTDDDDFDTYGDDWMFELGCRFNF